MTAAADHTAAGPAGDRPDDDRWVPAMLGLFAACPRCAALVDNRKEAVRRHLAWHDRQGAR